jgi:multisubunit Na+/H+ antiporter MnhF subunit
MTLDDKLEALTGMNLMGCIALVVVLIIYLGMFAVARFLYVRGKQEKNSP